MIQTGTVAAVAVAFGKFLGVFVPWVSAQNILVDLGVIHIAGHPVALTVSSQQLVAILVLLFLSVLNIFGLRLGAWVQNIFTVMKVGSLLGLVGFGWWWATRHVTEAAQVQSFWQGAKWDLATLTVVSVALVGPLFSADAWNNVTFTGAEVINPRRNLPLALFIGTTVICVIYFACNWIYLRVLPFYGSPQGGLLERGIQYAAEDRVATAVMQVMLGGKGAGLMAAAIIISTFGCMNGMILAGARVYYAMAKDGLFFHAVGKVSPKYHTPAVSLMVQAVWAALLTLSGTYSELLDYVIFAVVLFYILTITGVFRLRRLRPDAPRLLTAGVRLIQFRDKQASSGELFEHSRQIAESVRRWGGVFIVNDRADVARAVDANGVHVGQEDLPVELARRVLGPGKWVGYSTHVLEQVVEADRSSADYIAFGPIFPTQSKERPDPIVGLEGLREARKATRKPLVAIGGITVQNARHVIEAGADSVAVIRDLLSSPDIGERAKEFLRVLG